MKPVCSIIAALGVLAVGEIATFANAAELPLPAGAKWRQGSPRLRHPAGVSALAFAPDGKLLASAGFDGAVRLWDLADGKEVHALYSTPWEWRIYSLTFSPDGQAIAAGSGSGLFVWDVASKKLLRKFEGEAMVAAFSRDGSRIAGAGTRLSLWEADSGKTLGQSPADNRCIYGMAFSPDGKSVIYGHTGNKPPEMDLLVFDIAGKTYTRRLAGLKDWTHAILFSPDGKTLAAGGHQEVLLYDTATWELRSRLKLTVRDLAFVGKSNRLAIVGDRDVQVWDTATAMREKTLAPQKGRRSHLAVSPDGKLIATGDQDGRIRLWDLATGKERLAEPDLIDAVVNVAFAPDGKTLASHTGDYVVRLWEARTGRPRGVLTTGKDQSWYAPFGEAIKTLAFPRHGRVLVGGDWRGSIRVWDPADGKEIRRFKTEKGDVTIPLDLAPTGTLAALVSSEKTIDLWNIEEGKSVGRLHYAGKREDHFDIAFSNPAFSPDGSVVASICVPFEPIQGFLKATPSPPVPAPSIHLWETASGCFRSLSFGRRTRSSGSPMARCWRPRAGRRSYCGTGQPGRSAGGLTPAQDRTWRSGPLPSPATAAGSRPAVSCATRTPDTPPRSTSSASGKPRAATSSGDEPATMATFARSLSHPTG